MKVKAEMSIDSIFGMKADSGKISKRFRDLEADEMQACFLKLKQLVPTIPANKKISKVQLLQHVIDYILDLQLALETHPSVRSPPPQLTNTIRVPLGDLSMENTSMMPIFHEASHLEKLPAELAELTSRPVSC